MELQALTLEKALRLLKEKKISSFELTKYYLDRISKYDKKTTWCYNRTKRGANRG